MYSRLFPSSCKPFDANAVELKIEKGKVVSNLP